MRKCTVCEHMNADNYSFCEICGSKLEPPQNTNKNCIACGFKIEATAKFCRKCGAAQPIADVMTNAGGQQGVTPSANNGQIANLPLTNIPTNNTVPKTMAPNNRAPAKQPPTSPPIKPPQKKKSVIFIILVLLFAAVLAIGGTVYYLHANKLLFFSENEDETAENNQDNIDEQNNPKKTSAPIENESTPKPLMVDRSKPIKLSAQVTATSELDSRTYNVNNLIDNNADTAWAEGVDGPGVGESIIYHLNEEEMVYGIAILPGSLYSENAFYNNSCPISLKVTVENYTETINILNSDYPQFTWDPYYNNLTEYYCYIDFKQPIQTQDIIISLNEIFLGNEETTCISEMHLFTYPEIGEESKYSSNDWIVRHNPANEAYLLPSSERYLSVDDLNGFTAEQCRIARNEIYARHGRMFDDQDLQNYFNSCSWYQGTIPASEFNDDMLNEYEKANRDLITQYEMEQGYR